MIKIMAPLTVAALTVTIVLAGAATSISTSKAETYPEVIPLPVGWQPEGIVVAKGHEIYSGSLSTGAIYAADLRTGEGSILVPEQDGRVAVGLSFDERSSYIFAAGGPTGAAYVYDARTGQSVEEYALPVCAGGTFINDVVVTREAAYLTDSQCPMIYRIPLGPGGELADPADVEAVALGGDYQQAAGFNANGIDATPNGKRIIIVQSNTGLLFNVDPQTGEATTIDLGGDLVTSGDGILLEGKTLYVVRNFLNLVTKVALGPDMVSGDVVEEISDADFRIPTTIAGHGSRRYVVNARFGIGSPETAEYEIVRVPE